MKKTRFTLVAAAGIAWGAMAHAAPVQWQMTNGGNGHWYDFVILSSSITATDAESSTHQGQAGYLATITSARLCCANPIWDSSYESSMIAEWHEQLDPYEVQDHELVVLQ